MMRELDSLGCGIGLVVLMIVEGCLRLVGLRVPEHDEKLGVTDDA